MRRRYYLDMELIKRLMQERGLTEQILAEQMEIPQKRLHFYLYYWEQKRVSLKIVIPFYDAFKIPFNQLVTTTPPKVKRK